MGISKTHDPIKININIPNPSQEPPASSKAPNEDLKDMDVHCNFKIKIESQNLEHGCIEDQLPYRNQDQDAKPQDQCSDHMKILIKIPNTVHKLFQPKANHCKAELVLVSKHRLKAKKIIECWEENNTVSILQLGWDTNHFEALSYEYAAIQAV